MKKNAKVLAGLLLGTALVMGYVACSKNADDSSTTCGTTRLKSSPLGLVRDPSGTTKVYGMTLGASPDTVNISGSSITTSTTSYDMVFFNEKASTDCSATSTGLPAFILCGYTTGACVDTGKAAYDTLSVHPVVTYTADPVMTLPLTGTTYRCDDLTTLRRTPAQTLYNTGLIGNRFQNTADDYSDTYQRVYVLKVKHGLYYYYYAFMVQKFKNASSGSEAKKMTILYKQLR
jgi:hypothetical protein